MFGELVRAHRRRLGLTQEELAARAGVSVRSVCSIEADQVRAPRPATVRLLAQALELDGTDRDRFYAASAEAADHQPVARRSPAAQLSRPVPAQLPLDIAGFTGRRGHLTRMDASLPGTDDGPSGTVVWTLAGTAGVGKTTLAVHWAHSVAGEFPDGQLYVNLRGFDPSGSVLDPAEAVRGFLDAFGVPPERMPADLADRAALYRSLLAGKRVLVILDNARDAGQVRPLLPGAPGCLAVVTSRDQLTSLVALEGARPLVLDVLSAGDARELLARRLGQGRTAGEPDAVDQIISRCSRLPLALALVAARTAACTELPLAAVAEELSTAGRTLEPFADADPGSDMRTVFSWSYRTLSDASARLFRLLGLHPGPDITAPAAASLAGATRGQVRPLLAELARAHLVTEHVRGRYTFHDLLRAYAAERATAETDAADRHDAARRVLDHYLHTAHAATVSLNPVRDPIHPAPAAAGTTPERIVDHDHALAWFTDEHHVLVTAVGQAARDGFDTHAWQLAWSLTNFLLRRGSWQDLADTQQIAVAAALNLPPAMASARRGIGLAYVRMARYDEAQDQFQQALELYDECGDHSGQAHAHLNLSRLFDRQGQWVPALAHAEHALRLSRIAGHRSAQANALNAVGWCHAMLGDHRRALTQCQRALVLLEEVGDRGGAAQASDSLGYIHHHLGNYRQAGACYRYAMDVFQELGDRYEQACALTHLGQTHQAAGDGDTAREAWRQALDILLDLQHPDADAVQARLRELDHPVPGLRLA